MYEPVEGLYWHPGAFPYTFFYAIGLWMDGLVLQMVRHDSLRRRLLCFVPALLLAPIVGGSNYSIALVSAMLLFLLVVYLFWKKQRQNAVLSLVVLVLLTGRIRGVQHGKRHDRACAAGMGVPRAAGVPAGKAERKGFLASGLGDGAAVRPVCRARHALFLCAGLCHPGAQYQPDLFQLLSGRAVRDVLSVRLVLAPLCGQVAGLENREAV